METRAQCDGAGIEVETVVILLEMDRGIHFRSSQRHSFPGPSKSHWTSGFTVLLEGHPDIQRRLTEATMEQACSRTD